MSEPIVVRDSIIDAWTNQATNKTRKKAARLHVKTQADADRMVFMYPARAWPRDATQMINAMLGLKNGEAWAGSVTVTVRLCEVKWDVDKLTFTNKPTVVGPSATMEKTGAAANTLWEIDVTDLLQYAMDTGKWYGFRITATGTATKWFHSSEAKREGQRPYLSLEWSEAPEAPDNLQPGGETHVSGQFPPFSMDHNDTLGSTDITMLELEIFAEGADVEVAVPEFSTGQIPATEAEWTSAGSLWGGIELGTGNTWRARTKDDAEWSPWSDPETFYRTAKHTLTLLTILGGTVYSPTPTVEWSFGGTQTSFRVIVATSSNPSDWLWSSGKVPGTDTTYAIPFGVITDPDETYIIRVQVWDDVERVALVGDPDYTMVTSDPFVIGFDAAVTNITGLDLEVDPIFPVASLTFSRSSEPAEFFLLRSFDNVTWEYVAEHDASDVLVSGTDYEIIDRTAPSYRPVYWRVVPVDGTTGHQGVGMNVNGQIRRKAPMLFTPEGEDPCVFLNPDRSRNNNDVQEVYFPLNGEAVVVTQHLGRKMGKVSGVFTADGLAGTTAEEMLKSFRAHRKRKGQAVIVSTGNESFLAIPFNFDDDIIIDAEGIYYYAEFEWVEIGLGVN